MMRAISLLILSLIATAFAQDFGPVFGSTSSSGSTSTKSHKSDSNRNSTSTIPASCVQKPDATVTFDGAVYTIPIFNPCSALTYGPPPSSARITPSNTTTPAWTTDTVDFTPALPTSATAEATTGAAHARYPEIAGALAGGIFAGMALV